MTVSCIEVGGNTIPHLVTMHFQVLGKYLPYLVIRDRKGAVENFFSLLLHVKKFRRAFGAHSLTQYKFQEMGRSLNGIHLPERSSRAKRESVISYFPRHSMSNKRRRTGPSRFTVAKRPVDKSIINVLHDPITSSQKSTTLLTSSFPCTVTGLRWNLTWHNTDSGGGHKVWWAIVVVRDSATASTIGTSDGGSFYKPEENVLTYGTTWLEAAGSGMTSGTTKTMRKVAGGDTLRFIVLSSTATTTAVQGIIQLFCKS